MIQSIDLLKTALRDTRLEGRAIRELWPDSSVAPVFSIELEGGREGDELALLSSLMARTGCYPLLAKQDYVELIFLDTPPPESHLVNGDWVENTSAKALLIDGAEYLSSGGQLKAFSQTQTNDLFDWLDFQLDHWNHPLGKTLQRFGEAPSVQQIRDLQHSGTLRTDAELERWLFDWELERFGDAALLPPSVRYLDGHEFSDGVPCVAVLLPTLLSWKALLYMGWYGLEGGAAEKAAALRIWAEKYGAELVGSFGTTLHLRVKRRPLNVDEAFSLALEHRHFASDTLVLPGVSTRDHARALLSLDRWYFHSRP